MCWQFSAANAEEADGFRPAFSAYVRTRGATDSASMAAELIFGELVGNVVQHAPGHIDVRVEWPSGQSPTLVVRDRGPGFRLQPILPADALAERGRGLFLVQAFAASLTVRRRSGGGATVRARLPIPPASAGVDADAYATASPA